ncbi:MAG TPA: nucleoside 2-deoxyribosyltransferase [Pyrinomonadaceae bacterium]|nr:nucleoside 2-deoxyribosyltransferase [Pyrinomonadaceae bacterium]
MNIYFAGAIRGGREDAPLYFEIIELLGEYGRVLTEHVGNPELTGSGEVDDDREIHDRDLDWLKEADYLVAEVTTPSLGVGYEIGKATEWGTPTLCLYRRSEGLSLSAMIAGCASVMVREYQDREALRNIFADFFRADGA